MKVFVKLKTVETIPSLSVPDASKCFALITFITITICMSVQRALGCNAKLIQLFVKFAVVQDEGTHEEALPKRRNRRGGGQRR